jgi:hypothetical protein
MDRDWDKTKFSKYPKEIYSMIAKKAAQATENIGLFMPLLSITVCIILPFRRTVTEDCGYQDYWFKWRV